MPLACTSSAFAELTRGADCEMVAPWRECRVEKESHASKPCYRASGFLWFGIGYWERGLRGRRSRGVTADSAWARCEHGVNEGWRDSVVYLPVGRRAMWWY